MVTSKPSITIGVIKSRLMNFYLYNARMDTVVHLKQQLVQVTTRVRKEDMERYVVRVLQVTRKVFLAMVVF